MSDALASYLHEHRDQAYSLLRRFTALNKPFLLRSDLLDELNAFAEESGTSDVLYAPLGTFISAAQEAAVAAPWIVIAVRPRIGRWNYHRIHMETLSAEEIDIAEFLAFKEHIVEHNGQPDTFPLEIDLGPFNRGFPTMRESRSIGQGVSFLNRKLSSEMFQRLERGDERMFDFLHVHQFAGQQLMLNQRISDVTALRRAIRQADDFLSRQPPKTPWAEVALRMQELGFEMGWGRDVERTRDTLQLLSDTLEAPDPGTLERLLARFPMIFNLVVLTPHGYFGQSNVLGKPDTGGQVVYILDQVRALEAEMIQRLEEQGIDIEPQILVVTRLIPNSEGTSCDQRMEPIAGTQHTRILRVPFRDAQGNVIPHWISRFEIWPYLERFALEAEKEVLAELGGRPGLIIGNYSDGNLVASLMSRRLHVTQCNIAHALEKTKYLLSDLYWRDLDGQYHFSCQFTADLISMNTADFIITSTYQEIAGTSESVGQYESYSAFTMPGLYRVVNGINVFDPRFNIVSPGADPDVYFPYTDDARRLKGLHDNLDQLVHGDGNGSPSRGKWTDGTKPVIFTMARLDRIKNLTGLVDWYGNSPRLREQANLLIVGGYLDPEQSGDHEEREQIHRMHGLFERHELEECTRWVGFQSQRNFVGELYRYIADRRGVFVQPALFEAYGLTVVEAMSSGLPVFVTCYGGPSEIVEHGVSGYHVNPNEGAASAEQIAEFFETCRTDNDHWDRISKAAIHRIESRYTWRLYAERMMTLARVYGFWKYVTNLEREETRRYLEALYTLQYRSLVNQLPQ